MTIFVDTSALYAVLDATDRNHRRAAATMRKLIDRDEPLVTSNYVIVESTALIQNRSGIQAVRTAHDDLLSTMVSVWIDEETHARAVASVLAAGQRHLSLVDCTSFEVMRARGLRTAFGFDPDFSRQGFTTIP